jgi:uncharacterized protein YegJ (DUF2314 family)
MNYWKIAFASLALSPALTIAACAGEPTQDERLAERDDMKAVSTEDARMNAAIAEAQKTLPQFLKFMESNGEGRDTAGFKFPLGGWEHIWVKDVRREGDFLVGRLSNVPAQDGFQIDDEVRVALKDVSDWTWRDKNNVAQGHYTTKVLLDQMPVEQASEIRQALGW